jgi:CBS-domain-containing membrane protein
MKEFGETPDIDKDDLERLLRLVEQQIETRERRSIASSAR